MEIANQFTEELILAELGQRLTRVRLDQNLTQGGVAEQAGVSRRTVERFEAGESIQLSNLIRLCRALGLVAGFNGLIPEPSLSPMAQLKMRGKVRQRASAVRTAARSTPKWSWSDQA